MKRISSLIGSALSVLLLGSCLTITEKQIIPPPWRPAPVEGADGISGKPPVGQIAPVYYSANEIPQIDGNFSEWEGLGGVYTRVMVYGGLVNPKNTDGHFVVRTDGKNLYLFADITDDDPMVNPFPAPQAWRGDSVEFFFGTDTSPHKFYKNTDKRLRFVPKSKTNPRQVEISINDQTVSIPDLQAAFVYRDSGYQLEAKIPLSALNNNPLKMGQKVRLEFQINDADEGKERSRLVHWMSQEDKSYMDASTWGDGKVQALPKIGEVK
ncbi:sugar-binding protein [Gracilinema caldarium]|uniref:sugar-binding protein n=1 Tax=Gracilinema caldarium TaxID=215591 RepID=UPI0026EF3EA8|nr:sugar-binding protein [Gracilinema caldarium]